MKAGLRLSPNAQKDSKFLFVNVALAGLHNFFKFMKVMEDWHFGMLAVLPNFFQFTLELENILNFILCQLMRTVFWYVSNRGGTNLWLNSQFSRK